MRLPSRIGKKENFRLAAKQRHHRQLAYPTNAETRMMFQRVILSGARETGWGKRTRSPSERLRAVEQLKTDSRSDIILEAPSSLIQTVSHGLDEHRPGVVREMGRQRRQYRRPNVDKLGLVDIAAESDLIDGIVSGDRLIGAVRQHSFQKVAVPGVCVA